MLTQSLRTLLLAGFTAASMASATSATPTDDLFAAIKANDRAAVDAIIAKSPEAAGGTMANGVTPLMQAAYLERQDIVDVLRRAKSDLNFFEVCIVGDVGALRAYLARGQDVDALSPDGFTPLGLAVFFRQVDAARLLIDAGANVNAKARNSIGTAPIHAAVARGHLELLQLLLLRGADVNLTQQHWLRPLHEAAASGSLPVVGMLVLFGANAAAVSEDGRTPADFARASGHLALAQQLERIVAQSRPPSEPG
jgi:ankyrin repeat protein